MKKLLVGLLLVGPYSMNVCPSTSRYILPDYRNWAVETSVHTKIYSCAGTRIIVLESTGEISKVHTPYADGMSFQDNDQVLVSDMYGNRRILTVKLVQAFIGTGQDSPKELKRFVTLMFTN